MEVGVHEAKTALSKLLRRVAAGEEVVITRSGRPVARLVPVASTGARELGHDIGRLTVPAHALALAALPPHHRDPFDRLLVAQAQLEGLPSVTADEAIRQYEIEAFDA